MKKLLCVLILLLSVNLFAKEKIVYFEHDVRGNARCAEQIQKWIDAGWFIKLITTSHNYGIWVVFTTEKE